MPNQKTHKRYEAIHSYYRSCRAFDARRLPRTIAGEANRKGSSDREAKEADQEQRPQRRAAR